MGLFEILIFCMQMVLGLGIYFVLKHVGELASAMRDLIVILRDKDRVKWLEWSKQDEDRPN